MMFNFLKKKEKDVLFVDCSRKAYLMHPVEKAAQVKVHFGDKQVKSTGKLDFAQCPGMVDLKNYGYIIPAWDDINIMANESGVMVTMGTGRQSHFPPPRKMSNEIGAGIFTPQDNIPFQVWHIESPWHVVSYKPGMSMVFLPATYHAPFLDDIFVYPGIVDYNNYSSMNFIFSIKRKCNFTIKAGTPLYQVMPFLHIKDGITGGYGPATPEQFDYTNTIFSSAKQFYRKYILNKKPMGLKLHDGNSEQNVVEDPESDLDDLPDNEKFKK